MILKMNIIILLIGLGFISSLCILELIKTNKTFVIKTRDKTILDAVKDVKRSHIILNTFVLIFCITIVLILSILVTKFGI